MNGRDWRRCRRRDRVGLHHIEGIKGEQATALAVFMTRSGDGKEQIRRGIALRFQYDLRRTIEEVRPVYQWNVSCPGSMPEAHRVPGFERRRDAIRLAISLGGDADTQAAIAGGIAEGCYKHVPAEIVRPVRERLAHGVHRRPR